MVQTPNPFKPTAGMLPPVLVGRDQLLDEFEESLTDGPGAPGRLLRITGPRGSGKTAVIKALWQRVERRGWLVLSESATVGLVERLTDRLTNLLAHESKRRVQAVSLPTVVGTGGGGVSLAPSPQVAVSFRECMNRMLDRQEKHDAGVLITLDEISLEAREDLRTLATNYQFLVERNVAMALAGLPASISDLLNDDVLTFLRRATPYDLGALTLAEARDALDEPIRNAGRAISADALDTAARATGGYPFMVQLVGYHSWRAAAGNTIDRAAVDAGVAAARERLTDTVLKPALKDLSERDIEYLRGVAELSASDGRARTADVAAQLGVSDAYGSAYRARLIDARLLEPAGRGVIRIALPYLADHLRAGHADA